VGVPQSGEVCISILHPPVDDPQSGELPSERWNPTQNVRYEDISCIIFQANSFRIWQNYISLICLSMSQEVMPRDR